MASARKSAANTHLISVRTWSTMIANRSAPAITTSEIAATLTTARAWIRAASTEALQGSGSARALKSLHFDDPAAPQPGAPPSPPPSGGLALGGARAATDKVI